MYAQVFVERLKDYGSLVLCTIQKFDKFSRGSFYTLTYYIYIFFIIWIYFTLAYLCIIDMYILLDKTIYSFSLTAQHLASDWKWTSMISDRLPDCILCNHHLLIYCLSDIFYLYVCVYIYDKVKKQFVPHWVFVYAMHINENISYTRECLIKACVCVRQG
jgi:hypothetical protein